MLSAKLDAKPESTQEALLLHLKKQGEMTVAQLSSLLKITEMAVRRHLSHLQSKGLVESRLVNQGRGRPNYLYRLGPQAATLFPSGFDSLAKDLLHLVHEEAGPQGVTALLKKRNQMLATRLKDRMAGKDLSGRVAEVAKFFSEDGYMTDWQKLSDGNFMIFQRNCALHDLASEFRQICALEPKLIEELLGAKVTRQTHILNNDPVCGYLISK
jgi:DeoR family transcriptional regulator, suf operon transcriptional repressor